MKLNIKRRLLAFLLVILCLSMMVSYITLSVSSRIYGEILNKTVAEILALSTREFERRLTRIERLSTEIMTDGDLQEKIISFGATSPSYRRYRVIQEIGQRLARYYSSDDYIVELFIIDRRGEEIKQAAEYYGNRGDINRLVGEAYRQRGKNVWVPAADGETLISARRIRSIAELGLEDLGTVAIRIDVKRIIQDTVESLRAYRVVLALRLSEEVLFISDENFQESLQESFHQNYHGKATLAHLLSPMESEQGFSIFQLDRNRYFMAFLRSGEMPWTYAVMIPYDDIYTRIRAMNRFIVFFYLLSLFLLLFIGVRFTRSIIQPIENLASLLKKIEQSDFKLQGEAMAGYGRADEIGTLYREFHSMLGKIDTLINENYKKQIMIKDSQFKTLQAQINPHFLYNTLDSINWIAKLNGQEEIAVMIKSLGNILRSSISKQESCITIEREMDLLQDYLYIQKIRYEDRLRYDIQVPREIGGYAVPKLILQPLVENSIKYGLEDKPELCEITIRGEKRGDKIMLYISDNGPGMEDELVEKLSRGQVNPRGSGVGLKNIIDRLKIIYGEDSSLAIESNINRGTRVGIEIPALPVEDLEKILAGG